MSDPTKAITRSLACLILFGVSGCNMLPGKTDRTDYQPIGIELSQAQSADAYLAVRQARAQHSIVLQVLGDDEPFRILPLPTEGKSVFVSTLLEQTGVIKNVGKAEVMLYRPSPHAIDGLQMDVKMNAKGSGVRPETDYALQPGDRIQVAKVETDAFQSIIDMTLDR